MSHWSRAEIAYAVMCASFVVIIALFALAGGSERAACP